MNKEPLNNAASHEVGKLKTSKFLLFIFAIIAEIGCAVYMLGYALWYDLSGTTVALIIAGIIMVAAIVLTILAALNTKRKIYIATAIICVGVAFVIWSIFFIAGYFYNANQFKSQDDSDYRDVIEFYVLQGSLLIARLITFLPLFIYLPVLLLRVKGTNAYTQDK